MKIVIVGCGRVGAAVAEAYDAGGHDVVIVDSETSAFDKLPDGFHGHAVRGDGTDEDVLRKAGTEGADVFIALTEGDNRNVMAAQLAAEALGVGKSIAKLNDPVRAAAYADLGIATLCRTGLMFDSINDYLGVPPSGLLRDAGTDRSPPRRAAPRRTRRRDAAGRRAGRRHRGSSRGQRGSSRHHPIRTGGLSRVRVGRRRRQGRLLPRQGTHRSRPRGRPHGEGRGPRPKHRGRGRLDRHRA